VLEIKFASSFLTMEGYLRQYIANSSVFIPKGSMFKKRALYKGG
jgi:hypothetical protein